MRIHARRPNMGWVAALALTACLAMGLCPVRAQDPVTLVKDINARDMGRLPWLRVDGASIYFDNGTLETGVELWRSDGTATGTAIVRDICPGARSSFQGKGSYLPGDTCIMGSHLFFSATDPVLGRELWKSDGTTTGTALVLDINPSFSSSTPSDLTVLGSTLFFVADDGVHGRELWKSDGTTTGTALVLDINPSSSSTPSDLTVLGSSVFFAADDGVHGCEFWKTDGTATGTLLVKDIRSGPEGSSPEYLVSTGSTLFFWGQSGTSEAELWKSDGTEAGTVLVKPFEMGYREMVALNGGVLFTGDDGAYGYELWTSDGTTTGTLMLKDIRTGLLGSVPRDFERMGSNVFFTAYEGLSLGLRLWKTDGTTSGTAMVLGINPSSSSISALTAVGSTLFFTVDDGVHGNELWKTDGTSTGTTLVKDIEPGSGSATPQSLIAADSALYFTAFPYSNALELWKSDGTTTGTSRVCQMRLLTDSSVPRSFTTLGSSLLFVATDSEMPYELWKSDGTQEGTGLIKGLPSGMFPSPPSGLTPAGSLVFFSASDATAGQELWKSDGTPTGTALVKDIRPGPAPSTPQDLRILGSTCVFTADNGTQGRELWKSDGTAAGTVMIRDIQPGAGNSYPSYLTVVGPRVFFSAQNDTYGNELWVSDGTMAGTVIVKDIVPGAASCNPSELAALGSTLFFTSCNGWPYPNHLNKSDGTQEGTVEVITMSPYGINELTAMGPRLYFAADKDDNGILDLCATDGTAAGTVSVKANINPGWLVAVGSTLFLVADDGTHGAELWKSDGTPAGTVMVKDVFPGSGRSYCSNFTPTGSLLFFSANDSLHGNELWRSDGTEAGTFMVHDLLLGSGSGIYFTGSESSGDLYAFGSRLYFAADDGTWGTELYYTDGAGLAGPSHPGDINARMDALTWTWWDNSLPPFSEDGFKVYWGPGDTAPLAVTLTEPADATSCTVNGLLPNTRYAFQVAAASAGHGDSAKTANYAVYTAIEPVSGLTVSDVTKSGITIAPANSPSNLASGASGIRLSNKTAGTSSLWLRANVPWTSSGLNPNTEYTLSGKSRNGSGFETAEATTKTWTLIEPVAGLVFAEVSTTSLLVAASGAFSNLAGGLSGIRIENASTQDASSWRKDTSPWNSANLLPNTEYAFTAASRNGAGLETSGITATAWTKAATPKAPVVNNPTTHTLRLALGADDGNPAHTHYTVHCATTGQYVQADGTLGPTAVWGTAQEWEGVTVRGLRLWGVYAFRARARNGAGVETPLGPVASGMTVSPIPAEAKEWPGYE